jgi:hypothetical protein
VVKRTPVPPLNLRPADVLFHGPGQPEPQPRPNVKISAYLPGNLLADIDAYRTALLREHNVSIDRSRVLRDLVRSCLDSAELAGRLAREEEV